MTMNTSIIFLANGFEEIEALATADLMRRAGMPVDLVSINPTTTVTGANGITVVADSTINDIQDAAPYEWIVLPGGMPGAENLIQNDKVGRMVTAQNEAGGNIAAICAAPGVVLAPLGILSGKTATCYPGFEKFFPADAVFTGAPVEVSGNLVTGYGPGAAMRFAIAIVGKTLGQTTAEQLAAATMMK